ncbi:hypothetical protein OE88DRAFT_1658466 [Heliocybe sulcata]|uniref:Uncharacterized protein n=1 Tax=Heliocybe sulcata TaxID=5364 RepID=A0A5C3N5S6_9AGAM|nr:hypothetical protein OE88DRAFT_1658466 [Heliocybe sulcata]
MRSGNPARAYRTDVSSHLRRDLRQCLLLLEVASLPALSGQRLLWDLQVSTFPANAVRKHPETEKRPTCTFGP